MVIEYDKIIVNIPRKLLEEFDKVAEINNYSRSEAVKESMRIFIKDQMPEDYVPKQMRGVVIEAAEDAGVGLIQGMAKAAESPQVKRAQLLNPPQSQYQISFQFTPEDEKLIQNIRVGAAQNAKKFHEQLHYMVKSFDKRIEELQKKGIPNYPIYANIIINEAVKRDVVGSVKTTS